MAEYEELKAIDQALQMWPDLTPDQAEMNRVAALMVAGLAAAHQEAAEPGESDFRLLTIVWASVALGGYLAWDLLAGWFALHPFWTAVLIAFGCASVVAPLLLVPILRSVEGPALE